MYTDNYGQKERVLYLALRLCTLVALVALLTIHIRSLRVFRWEQSVSGGIVVTYCIASAGLALCTAASNCGGITFQAYICSVGAVLLAVNAVVLMVRWQRANQLTMVIADLLVAVGVPVKKQIIAKVILSALAALALLIDLLFVPFRENNSFAHLY